ncbi:MAG TPA: hypothetical protein VMV06_04465, partial [Acidimicrobiales bacterium]|nr:hypothetical protein [Acidimicrobiales bacterium]
MSPEQSSPGVIDVYVDTVPGPRQRTRGLRSQVHPVSIGADDFQTPVLETPVIERPAVWAETEATRDQVIEQARALEPIDNREMRRRLSGIEALLDWLQTFPGDTWQQRWLASGVDTAGTAWPELSTRVFAGGRMADPSSPGPLANWCSWGRFVRATPGSTP